MVNLVETLAGEARLLNKYLKPDRHEQFLVPLSPHAIDCFVEYFSP
jgi:hypothetical protein